MIVIGCATFTVAVSASVEVLTDLTRFFIEDCCRESGDLRAPSESLNRACLRLRTGDADA